MALCAVGAPFPRYWKVETEIQEYTSFLWPHHLTFFLPLEMGYILRILSISCFDCFVEIWAFLSAENRPDVRQWLVVMKRQWTIATLSRDMAWKYDLHYGQGQNRSRLTERNWRHNTERRTRYFFPVMISNLHFFWWYLEWNIQCMKAKILALGEYH